MRIINNGSKWAGEAPDPVEKLIERLKTEVLDPTFEKYGNFVMDAEGEANKKLGILHVWGNFYTVSGVFSLMGTLEELSEIIALIRENQTTAAYKKARDEVKARDEQRAEREKNFANRSIRRR